LGKFIHAADIHLDSPLRGLERYAGAPEHIRNATRQAFDNLIELAIEEEVDFVLIAGDVYDGDWRDYNTGLYFATRMNHLREAGIKVFIVRGNHDAANHMTRALSLPDNVHVFSHEKPETVLLSELGVAIHGQSFAARAVTDNIARAYPDPERGFLNIGLLHTALEGREGHEPYAPCSVMELTFKGYDYWALGHVHRREMVNEGSPWIVYPGNLQARHINEEGAKGCTLVTYENGKITGLEERHLDVLRWSRCIVDCTNAHTPEDILELIRELIPQEIDGADGRPVVFRFELTGASKAHPQLVADEQKWLNEIRLAVLDAAGGSGWLEKVKFRTSMPTEAESLVPEHLPRGFLIRYFAELEADAELMQQLQDEFRELKSRLPGDLFADHAELDLDNPPALQEILTEAKYLAESKLAGQEVSAGED
jgi:DNA repair exonuclease SbcCD nuclease subunit